MKDSNSPSDVAMGGDAGGGVAQLDAQIEQLVKCVPLSEAEVSLTHRRSACCKLWES